MTATQAVGRSAVLAKRGTKQTCENETCGSRFYDLKRVPSACPYCWTACDVPAAVMLNFETLEKQDVRKFKRWAEPQKPAVETPKAEEEVADEQSDKEEDELPSAGEELLIEIEDDDDAQEPVENKSE